MGIKDTDRVYRSYVHQLSGGMRQRAMIAMALVADPVLLIADEPSTALDVTIQAQVLQQLQSIQQQREMSMLFISHDLAVVQQMSHHVVVMRRGECVEQSSASDFFAQPQQPYSKQLLQDVPSVAQCRNRATEFAHKLLAGKCVETVFSY